MLPYEYAYVDAFDLAAKIKQILEFGKARISEMGEENRNVALSIAERCRLKLLEHISQLKT